MSLRAAIATAIVLSAAAPAAAVAEFGKPFTVAGTGEQFPNGFSGVVNPSGTSAFAWTYKGRVRFRVRSAGGDLSDALKVSASGHLGYVPQIALDRDGNAMVAWHEQTGESSFALYAASRPRGGRFGAPQRVGPSFFSSDFADDNYPLVRFDSRGNAVAAWRYPQTYVGVAWAAPGGRFGAPQRLLAIAPRSITFRHDGRAALFSVRAGSRIVEATAAPRRPFTVVGDPFQVPMPAARGIADLDARQAPDSAGLAVWREGYAGDPGVGPDAGPVHAAIRRPGAAFGPEQVLSERQSCGAETTDQVLRATGAITTRDEALVTWLQCVGDPQATSSNMVLARRWSPTGGWDPVTALGPRELLGGPAPVTADSGGDLAVGWLADARQIAVMGMRPGGVFTPIQRLHTSGDARRTGPRVAADGHRAVVMWGSGDAYQAALGAVGP